MQIRARERLLVLMMYALVIVVGTTPIADLFVFGLHTHVGASERREAEVSAPNGDSALIIHHCELSASPAAVAAACGPLTPTLVASPPFEARAFVVVSPPRLLFPPPRT